MINMIDHHSSEIKKAIKLLKPKGYEYWLAIVKTHQKKPRASELSRLQRGYPAEYEFVAAEWLLNQYNEILIRGQVSTQISQTRFGNRLAVIAILVSVIAIFISIAQ